MQHKSGNIGGGGGGGHSACAACKHQRKRCDEKCVLSTVFPAHKVREFKAVHKVFGVSNVQKIMRGLQRPEDRRRAVDSLVWEAFCRQKDPVLGSYGEYWRLVNELRHCKCRRHHLPPQGGFTESSGALEVNGLSYVVDHHALHDYSFGSQNVKENMGCIVDSISSGTKQHGGNNIHPNVYHIGDKGV